jgi:hypothetical protein
MTNLDNALIQGARLAIGVPWSRSPAQRASRPIAGRCSNSVASSGNLAIAYVGFLLVQLVNDRYAE